MRHPVDTTQVVFAEEIHRAFEEECAGGVETRSHLKRCCGEIELQCAALLCFGHRRVEADLSNLAKATETIHTTLSC
jgi:hypothetical protein